jgi:LacI family transcriptional regulator
MTFLHVHNGGRLLKRVENAFISTLQAQNHPYEIKNCDDSYSSTYEDFKQYFKFNKSGYFIAYRDSIAAAITNAAIESGLRIPEDVEVLSIIGTRYSRILRPSISSMNVDFTEVGRRSVVMLNDLINGSLNEKVAKFTVKIAKRESTIE